MRTYKILAGTAAAAAIALCLGASPAFAATGPGAEAVMLTVNSATSQGVPTASQTVSLTCSPVPDDASPSAVAACTSLTGVQGDIAALPAAQTYCPEIYLPVTASAVGVWDGQQISYQQTFTNQCFLLRATGPVFNF